MTDDRRDALGVEAAAVATQSSIMMVNVMAVTVMIMVTKWMIMDDNDDQAIK